MDRHAHAGRRDGDVLVTEDLARLGDHLALLGGVVVPVLERLDLGQDVESDLVRIDRGARPRGPRAARPLARASPRRPRGRCPKSTGRWRRHPLDTGGVVDRLECHDHLHRRAVRVGDDAVVARQVIGVDLGDDQRHALVHAPGARVVDDDGSPPRRTRSPFGRDRAAGREESEVESLDRVGIECANLERAAAMLDLSCRRSARRQTARSRLAGKSALGHHVEDRRADHAGRARPPRRAGRCPARSPDHPPAVHAELECVVKRLDCAGHLVRADRAGDLDR